MYRTARGSWRWAGAGLGAAVGAAVARGRAGTGAAPLRAAQLADCSTGVPAILPHSAHDPS
jgi:hypothetical protein